MAKGRLTRLNHQYQMTDNANYTLHLGNCLDVLKDFEDNSIDSIVTDPPYGLSFMGKKWDYDVPSTEIWKECLRVLKPGGHLLAFAGTRTQHRMAVNIEDAGFEIRDMIAWVYGSGFPKSLDVSKAIDKRGGNAHLTAEIGAALKAARKARGISMSEADRTYCGGVTLWSWYEGRPAGRQMPSAEVIAKVAADWPELQHYADLIAEAEREVVKQQRGTVLAVAPGQGNDRSATTLDITAPATDAAKQWAGWGTALKPALEPITVARKPFKGTVAACVLEHGTGALNVDGCRVAGQPWKAHSATGLGSVKFFTKGETPVIEKEPHALGRWPANLILTYPEDEYKLKDNITPQQLAKLAEWMNENA
jgi:transcriptional regulator with XRE-family HTH domain